MAETWQYTGKHIGVIFVSQCETDCKVVAMRNNGYARKFHCQVVKLEDGRFGVERKRVGGH